MQIKSMPSSLFKNKWNHFIHKISSPPSPPEEQRQQQQQQRKYSDAMSVDSNISMTDKFRQALPTFLRRNSSTNTTHNNNDIHSTSSVDLKELEKFQALYVLTLDELNYAEDSKGSSYYSGDLVAAREALDDCTSAFMQLLRHTTDPITREALRNSIIPKLLKLQRRIKALPEDNEMED